MKNLTLWNPNLGDVILNAAALAALMGGLASPALAAVTGTGASSLAAAGIAGGGALRSGQSAAATDTTDTAAAIIAAAPAFGAVENVGQSFVYTYINNGAFPITLAGGTGVTVSEQTVVPPNSSAQYLVTYSAAGAVTMVGIGQAFFVKRGTFTANGATPVTVADTRVTATSQVDITLKTVGGTVSPTRPNILTITPGTGFTVGGVALDTSIYNYEIRG